MEMNYKYGIIYFAHDVSECVFDRSYIGFAKDLDSLREPKEGFEYSDEGLFSLTKEGLEIFDEWHEDVSRGCDLCNGEMQGLCQTIGGTDIELWDYLTANEYLSNRITD